MSATTTSSAPAATCTGYRWELPVQDVACALPNRDNGTDIMEKCCGVAEVQAYNDDCDLYCLAQGQDLGSLRSCLADNGAPNGEYFCSSSNSSATATAPAPSATSDNDNSDGDANDSNDNNDDSSNDTGDNAGVSLNQPVSKAGLGVLAMLVCSAVMGVMA